MKSGTAVSIMVTSVLALASMSSMAQKGQSGGAAVDRAQQVDRDRTYDRDRTSDRDRTQDRTRIDAQKQDQDQDRDQDRDRIHDPVNMSDKDIYGNELMSTTERAQYRKEIGNLETQAARNEFQARHEARMQERALLKDQDLVPPGQGPIYGGKIMSVKERNEYREQLRTLGTQQEQEKFQAQHRDRITKRADALGVEVEDAE